MKYIQLQNVGKVPAISVSELKLGTRLMWNYGYTDVVIGMEPTKSGKSIKLLLRSDSDGITRKRMMRADSLVALA